MDKDGKNTDKPNKKSRSRTWSIVGAVAWLLLLGLLVLKFFVYQQVTVVGESMQPNYYTGQLLLVDQINKTFNRGQVVAVYEDPSVAKTADYWTRFKTTFYLKRIIGLPGEEVEMVGGKVIIYNNQYPNGVVLSEDYISSDVKDKEEAENYYYPKTKVPDNNYFVMGDNRVNSLDSREKGTFPNYAIFGQETLRFWPFANSGLFSLPNYTYTPLSDDIISKINYFRQTQTQDNNSF
jgi:signal peptidase I